MMSEKTMQAAVLDGQGAAFRLASVRRPAPQPGQLPMLTGEGRGHHGEIMREATRLVEAGQVLPRVDPRNLTLSSVADAYRAIEASDAGKIVVDIG
jgi:hypothetical protein